MSLASCAHASRCAFWQRPVSWKEHCGLQSAQTERVNVADCNVGTNGSCKRWTMPHCGATFATQFVLFRRRCAYTFLSPPKLESRFLARHQLEAAGRATLSSLGCSLCPSVQSAPFGRSPSFPPSPRPHLRFPSLPQSSPSAYLINMTAPGKQQTQLVRPERRTRSGDPRTREAGDAAAHRNLP